MGRSCLFECPRCGYKARVSGRTEQGIRFAVQTVTCRNRKQLYDAVTRLKIPAVPDLESVEERALPRKTRAPAFDAVLNRLSFGDPRKLQWAMFKLSCPVSLDHQVQPWKEPGKCPRCGTYLERNALPFRIWD